MTRHEIKYLVIFVLMLVVPAGFFVGSFFVRYDGLKELSALVISCVWLLALFVYAIETWKE